MERYEFLVDQRPFCIWDWDLADKNRRFLRGIDPEYFRHVATVNGDILEQGENKHAALSLRLAYSHALEGFCALAGAAFQAPSCPMGWLLQYSNGELIRVIEKISAQRGLATRLNVRPSWSGLAEAVVQPAKIEESLKPSLKKHLTVAWTRFASDFIDRGQRDEYNSVKHGFRVAPGGFVLRVGLEPSYGVAPPESEMHTLGASQYGSSFFTIESPVGGKIDFRPRRCSRNWDTEHLFFAVDLLATSMIDVLALLLSHAGEDPANIRFQMLADDADYLRPWRRSIGVTMSNLDTIVEPTDIAPSDGAAIKDRLL